MTDRKITRFTVENFMRLKAVDISPSGDVVYITGANPDQWDLLFLMVWFRNRQPLFKHPEKGSRC